MLPKTIRFLLLCLLTLNVHAGLAQSKPAYQYMQLFYYGSSPLSAPIGIFSPALRGQTDIVLAEPTAYMKGATAMMSGGIISSSQQDQSVTVAENIDPFNMTPAQRKQQEEQAKKRKRESQEELEKYVRIMADHKKAHLEKITQSLNTAAADGWEVTQMSSFGTDGVVYLLRKAR